MVSIGLLEEVILRITIDDGDDATLTFIYCTGRIDLRL